MLTDAILGKAHTISFTTSEGVMDTFDVMVSFDHEARSEPAKRHLMGRMNISSNPKTSTSLNATMVLLERNGVFEDFYINHCVKKEFAKPYPDITIKEVANYDDGTTRSTKWGGVLITGRSKSGSGDDFKEMSYTIEMDADRVDRG